MARMELKRSREGVNILTLQYEMSDEELEAFLRDSADYPYASVLSERGYDAQVAFVDRPARGAVVEDLTKGAEVEGPAEFHFEEVRHEVHDKRVEVEADEAEARGGARDARFDEKGWFERDVERDDERFGLEAK